MLPKLVIKIFPRYEFETALLYSSTYSKSVMLFQSKCAITVGARTRTCT